MKIRILMYVRKLRLAAIVVACGFTGLRLSIAGAAVPGDVVFRSGFDTADERAAWSEADFAAWVPGWEATQSLSVVVSPEAGEGTHMVRMPLDLTPFRGCRLLFECVAKARDVTEPSASYLGVKFMLHYTSEQEGPFWTNESGVNGTFDWRTLRFTTRVASDAGPAELNLGLQASSGTVWFDDLKITLLGGPIERPAPMENPPPAFKGHSLPRLRGVMSPSQFREEDLRVLGQDWNANLIRWQMVRNWGRAGTDRDLEEYDRWIGGKLDELDSVLDACDRFGIRVVIDLHSPPGGRYENNDLAIFNEPVYQDHFVALWERIARRFRGRPAIWGYDLINEPVQNLPSPAGVPDYLGAQVRAARAIRAIDPETPIFIAAAEWDSAQGFRELEPIDIPRVIYQVHMYVPSAFTHQGVHGAWTPTAYPGRIEGEYWDKARLRSVLEPVRVFQRAYNVHIYVGEFSAIRWAPGAVDYLRDCIELFEEYDWDWSYHAYREWDGWSVEHGDDPEDRARTQEPSDRMRLLLEWFARNKK